MESQKVEIEIIRNSELFDAKWYVDMYSDILLTNIDPAEHYFNTGHLLLRDPSPHFSTSAYLRTYTDIAKTKVNPLYHYLKWGKDEKRKIFESEIAKQKISNHQFTLDQSQKNKTEEITQISVNSKGNQDNLGARNKEGDKSYPDSQSASEQLPNGLAEKLRLTQKELLETKQENELLLLQLCQVQEELKLLYLSQHEMDDKESN